MEKRYRAAPDVVMYSERIHKGSTYLWPTIVVFSLLIFVTIVITRASAVYFSESGQKTIIKNIFAILGPLVFCYLLIYAFYDDLIFYRIDICENGILLPSYFGWGGSAGIIFRRKYFSYEEIDDITVSSIEEYNVIKVFYNGKEHWLPLGKVDRTAFLKWIEKVREEKIHSPGDIKS